MHDPQKEVYEQIYILQSHSCCKDVVVASEEGYTIGMILEIDKTRNTHLTEQYL